VSLVIQKIGIDGFRKFRAPIAIENLTEGLNIIIEPNEVGKSTLLEALRAAFFVRYNTKNQLAQSYAPHGDAIGPKIEVSFVAEGKPWSVAKRFLKNPSIDVIGPQGRAQGEEAEARLNALLGSTRDTSRAGDVATYGALGLLWVAQTEALSVSAPGQIVRDTVHSTLEAEVGSIMGGPAYKKVSDRIETQYATYWTPTGQKRGRQIDVRDRLEKAEAGARQATERSVALEQNFSDLEGARARLKVVDREIADDTDAETRKDLVASLDVARAAAQILATRNAEHEAVGGKLKSLEDLDERHQAATKSRDEANGALTQAREKRAGLGGTLNSAGQKVADTRRALDTAKEARQAARTALAAGEAIIAHTRRLEAIKTARGRHDQLLEFERKHQEAKATAATAISAKSIASLESNDRAVAAARAALAAGATRVNLAGSAADITIDGEAMPLGERTLFHETQIRFGKATLTITPPASAASATEALGVALQKQNDALREVGVEDIVAARVRNDAARDAAAEIRTLEAQIASVTLADSTIELSAGADALKLFVAGLDADDDPGAGEAPNLVDLTAALSEADTALNRAEGAQESAVEALRRIEAEDLPLATAEAGAASDLTNATAAMEAIEKRAEWAGLADALVKTREMAADAAVKLEEAKRNATAHDQAAIVRKIETIDARARTALDAKARLETDIARLEGTIESEGGRGLAEREAAAKEEVEAARAALQRCSEEADTLKLLRDTLETARNETSAKFVGPVAKRAKRYIERLLPGCDLTFSEDLALQSVTRAGVDEHCANLSRGTQEQLAILTRIAFADMLLEEGQPVSLILDDPLVYSDDARLDLMIDILTEASQRMQVILLTCRDRAFRHVPGTRISLGARS
jgi:uncharacterized protein YhaN